MMVLSLIFGRKYAQSKVGTVSFDTMVTEEHRYSSRVTYYPVENGTIVSDHIINQPDVVVLSGLVTDTPLTILAPYNRSVAAFNQLIEWICWYNWTAPDKLPKFRLYENDPPTLDRANIDKALFSMGVKFKPEYIERTYGINSEEFELGDAPQIQIAGMRQPGDISPAEDTGGVSVDNESIAKAGIEAKDQSSNEQTKKAINRSQKKGYPY